MKIGWKRTLIESETSDKSLDNKVLVEMKLVEVGKINHKTQSQNSEKWSQFVGNYFKSALIHSSFCLMNHSTSWKIPMPAKETSERKLKVFRFSEKS